jgi:hypothetical protein
MSEQTRDDLSSFTNTAIGQALEEYCGSGPIGRLSGLLDVASSRLVSSDDVIARLRDDLAQLRRDDLHPCESGARICDRPGCLAGVVRADNGTRHCVEGHPLRWVAIDSQGDMRAELYKLRAVVERVSDLRERMHGFRVAPSMTWVCAELDAALAEPAEGPAV